MSLLVFTIRLCNALFFLNVILLENKVKTLPHSALSTLCDHAFLFLVPQMDCSATCSIIFPGFEDKLTGFKFLESVSSLKKKKKLEYLPPSGTSQTWLSRDHHHLFGNTAVNSFRTLRCSLLKLSSWVVSWLGKSSAWASISINESIRLLRDSDMRQNIFNTFLP